MKPALFWQLVLDWFDQHGRRDLPWQQQITPYRVWVSEIMLQQTQVQTVIPYFERFMAAYPDVASLAGASEDEVLHQWSGLGYYSRGRNLLKCARRIVADCGGTFPREVAALCELPGIGRSTAGAICSIAFGQPAAVLDGNVKRVLARFAAVEGWPGQSPVAAELWQLAESLVPQQRAADYSQAMMDLGATLCTRAKPNCGHCPLAAHCAGLNSGDPGRFPGKKPRKQLPVKATCMPLVRNRAGELLLVRRPSTGIWGGLWSFPEIADAGATGNFCIDQFNRVPDSITPWQVLRHSFTHYHLDISPVLVQLDCDPGLVLEGADQLWYKLSQPAAVGMPAPVSRLLKLLDQQEPAP